MCRFNFLLSAKSPKHSTLFSLAIFSNQKMNSEVILISFEIFELTKLCCSCSCESYKDCVNDQNRQTVDRTQLPKLRKKTVSRQLPFTAMLKF